MRRATDKTYPQNTSQIAIYAAARKFRFFIIILQNSERNFRPSGAGFSLRVFAQALSLLLELNRAG
jgi:hypothetical protein